MTDELSRLTNGEDPELPPEHSVGADGSMVCGVCATAYGADMRFCPLDGSVLRPVTDGRADLIGMVMDSRYYLTKKLGHGGMGDVYLGKHVRTQRLCAVKVVNRMQSRDPESLGRFLREATNAGRISHPNVATVYDFGETGEGLFYLAMEYVDGEPLSRLLEREHVLPPARAVEIARQVAEGVSAAHELGIVHRDLTPGNILIARDRKNADLVKVVDFGIARAPADEQQNLTRTGFVVGTPEYMSPEQLIGDPVDGRSDIYSLGCILYQMLTGEQAFGGATAQVITRRLTERPPRPREKNPAVPKALDDLIVTALGRTPQERFQSMDALRAALLEAPAQPPATGPHRLVAWLGGLQSRTHATEIDPPVTLGPVTPPVMTGATAVIAAAGATDPDMELPPIELPPMELPPVDAELIASAESEADGEDVFAEDADEGTADVLTAEDEPADAIVDAPQRRRFPLRNTVMAASSVIVLVVLLAFFRDVGGRGTDAGPIPVDTPTPPPPAPVTPDAAVLAEIWQQMSLAKQADFEDQYDAAITTLLTARIRLEPVLAEFPENIVVRILADSLNAQLQGTTGRCTSLRKVNVARNQPAPECPVELMTTAASVGPATSNRGSNS